MRKSSIIVLMCMCVLSAFSQEVTITSNEYPHYQGVVTVDSLSAKDIYNKIRVFVATQARDSKEIIQLDNADEGVMILKGAIITPIKLVNGKYYDFHSNTTLKFETKEAKFRYTADVTSIVDPVAPNAGDMMETIRKKPTGKYQMAAVESVTAAVNDYIAKLAASLAEKNEDW